METITIEKAKLERLENLINQIIRLMKPYNKKPKPPKKLDFEKQFKAKERC